MESLELLILKELVRNEEYFSKVIPFIEPRFFDNVAVRKFVNYILHEYSNQKENKHIVSIESLKTAVDQFTLTDEQYREVLRVLDEVINYNGKEPIDSLLDKTQQYFKKQMAKIAISMMLDKTSKRQLPTLEEVHQLEDSINFTFDQEGYYNYLGEFENRLVEYEEDKKKYEFPLVALNNCTNGGMNSKSLTIAMASTGGGKSIFLCNTASHLIMKGSNVLYITCEMSVQEISKRIDANLLNATQDSITLNQVHHDTLKERMINNYPDRNKWGKLYIKEYPAGYANATILRRDIEEIQRLYDIKIDVLVLDYLNLLNTVRYSTKTATSYTLVKAIAEEVRGIGQDFDIPVVSATQSNRSALNKETRLDAGLEAVSESFGLPQTADFMFNIISPDDVNWKNYRLFRILKNRWGDPSKEYIKVHLDTRFARFSDVAGWEVGRDSKPTELLKTFEDRSGGAFTDNSSLEKEKLNQEIQDKCVSNNAATNLTNVF